jgi:GWxTD domain-containing protein
MKTRMIRIVLSIGFCFSILLGQTEPKKQTSHSKFTVNASYSRFRYTDTQSYLEMNYAAYPSLVSLIQDSVKFKGIVDFQTIIRNTETDSLYVNQQASLPIVLTDTDSASMNKPLVSKFIFVVPVGSYTLEVRALDRLNPSRKDSIILPLKITAYAGKTGISDVDLCSSVTESKNKDSRFYKNSYEVIPNPSLFFGASTLPVIFTYAELYNLKPDSLYILNAQIIDGMGRVVKERARPRRFRITDAVDVSTITTTNIASGKYKFCLSLADSIGNKIVSAEKIIFIYNPKIVAAAAGLSSTSSTEFAVLSENELNDEFRKARYIAYPEDIKMFDKLSTAEAKREFLAKFWSHVESGERGRTDFTRAVYLERVLNAMQRYRVMGREGWRTDRGRVYVLYAEPDDIQRFPSSDNSKPYEIWKYYQIENGVDFVFIDHSGFGDYRLVHSTKRGEIRDDSWQNQLQ